MIKKSIGILGFLSVCSFVPHVYAEETLAAKPSETTPIDNKVIGQAFLAKNMTVPGVVTLADGLQYKVLKQGQGPMPTAKDTVTVHYAGRLINGTEFDSSYKRGEPAKFGVSDVIPGWTEALQRMNKGAIWELYIPASLAYGDRGVPPTIGPNETLIFKVELIDINK
ncbi:MAG: FKBP-type peptidyl-prolyl cis-trans isomerase [Gammaproteobacteria bacterium]|nr:FKBP-type peptidyl-prolyl cis-trans isomerase [Gammaproteobacteria bacterium]